MLTNQKLSLTKLVILSAIILITACSTSHLWQVGDALHIPNHIIKGTVFKHRVWLHMPAAGSETLNIYLHGDGQPWLAPNKIASDPTPLTSLTFHLWQQDPGAKAFIGRPCYFFIDDVHCTPHHWTDARYSKEVRDSLIAVIKEVLKTVPAKHIRLIGYSGGGTLAVLIADKLDNVDSLITLAGNLDIDTWTTFHNYSPLSASLNPIIIELDVSIDQHHLVGGKDRNIMPTMGERFFLRNNIKAKVYDDFTHNCCWQDIWAEYLSTLTNNN